MEFGTVLSKKAEGDSLSPQDVLAEVETDKAAMEIEVFDSGVLLKILAEEGDWVPAGQPIAILGTSADEDVSDLLAQYAQIKANAGTGAAAARLLSGRRTCSDCDPAPFGVYGAHGDGPDPVQLGRQAGRQRHHGDARLLRRASRPTPGAAPLPIGKVRSSPLREPPHGRSSTSGR